MNSNAFIDQAAAIILTSVGKARELGIPAGPMGLPAWLRRRVRSLVHLGPAQLSLLARHADRGTRGAGDGGDRHRTRSTSSTSTAAFPRRSRSPAGRWASPQDDPRGLTVTGGLPYFGGPGNNYVTHSIAQMMDEVRKAPGSKGLVTANGNYVTKQSAGIYSTEPPSKPFAPEGPRELSGEIDGRQGSRRRGSGQRGGDRGDLYRHARPQGPGLRHPVRTPRRRATLHRQHAR